MGIGVGSVSHYGEGNPKNGAKPLWTGPPPAIPVQPFGKDPGVNAYTGKHIPLHKEEVSENQAQAALALARGYLANLSPNEISALQQLARNATFNTATGQWEFGETESITSLAELTDTEQIEGAEDGNALVFDKSLNAWIPGEVSSLAELTDTEQIEEAEDGNALVFDESLNAWIPGAGLTAPEDPGMAVDTIGSVDETGAPTEGSETASSDTWTAGGSWGLAEWYVSRVVYDETGSKTIYAFLRLRTYDLYGRLYSISEETRVVVDAAVGV